MRNRLRWVVLVFLLAGCTGTSPSPSSSLRPTSEPTSADTIVPSSSPSLRSGAAGLTRVTVPVDGIGWDTAAAVVRGSDRYLALGWHYEPNPHIGYNGGTRLWASTDGVAWERLRVPAEFEFVPRGAVSLVATPSGEFLLFGNSHDADYVLRPVVMRSTDGVAWDVERVDLPGRLYLIRVVSGPKGYLLAGRGDGPGGLWLSPDGLAWSSVHALTQTDTTYESITDIGVGDDGFVAVGATGVRNGDSAFFALASGDGSTWFRSDEPFPADDGHAGIAFVAPIGGDWVATTGWTGTATQFWRSANGLQWERAGVLEQAPPINPALASAGGQLFYSNTGTEVPVGQPGGWTSADGVTWTPVDLGPDGVLAGAYEDPHGLMLVGAVVVSDDQADAAFWRPR